MRRRGRPCPRCEEIYVYLREGRLCKSCRKDTATSRKIEYKNLTGGEYYALYIAQKRRCAICGRNANEYGGGNLVVDHDHSTGLVRSLLCRACNTGIGFFSEDVSRMQKAIDYLGAS